jgi:hypothetical protein
LIISNVVFVFASKPIAPSSTPKETRAGVPYLVFWKVATLWWSRRLECCGFRIQSLWFRYSSLLDGTGCLARVRG